jgi:hypothetical protein
MIMASNSSVYDQLVQIAADKAPQGYLAHYRDDLFRIDRECLEAPIAGQYIWILRTCGTALFPIAVGHDALWATYWLDRGNTRESPSLAYLLTLADNSVRPITYERATQLAHIPAPDGRKVRFSLAGDRVEVAA